MKSKGPGSRKPATAGIKKSVHTAGSATLKVESGFWGIMIQNADYTKTDCSNCQGQAR